MGKVKQLAVFLLVGTTILLAQNNPRQIPHFKVDPLWPKPLPNHWLVGAVAGVALDSKDHVWIIHRPSTLQPNEIRASYRGAPPVLEFDPEGNLVSSWGGPENGYEWPELEHGIYVDSKNNVWVAGAGAASFHNRDWTPLRQPNQLFTVVSGWIFTRFAQSLRRRLM